MTSKSLHNDTSLDSSIEIPALPQNGFFSAIINWATTILTRSNAEQARARYQAKREHAVNAELHRDIVGSLPVEKKLSLGMYRFMDQQ